MYRVFIDVQHCYHENTFSLAGFKVIYYEKTFLFAGFKVITFKNPYLGNTCVPFQHWACSIDCAKALEIPARIEQIAAAQELDRQYEEYVDECHRKFQSTHRSRVLSCRSGSPEGSEGQGHRGQQQKTSGAVVHAQHSVSRSVPEDATGSGCECVLS